MLNSTYFDFSDVVKMYYFIKTDVNCVDLLCITKHAYLRLYRYSCDRSKVVGAIMTSKIALLFITVRFNGLTIELTIRQY